VPEVAVRPGPSILSASTPAAPSVEEREGECPHADIARSKPRPGARGLLAGHGRNALVKAPPAVPNYMETEAFSQSVGANPANALMSLD
jgi:hypothetical protein